MLKTAKFVLGSYGTNCYLIINEAAGVCFAVDPAADAGFIAGKIKERGLRLSGILLTHAHFDHIMALEELRRTAGVPVHLHADENEMLCDPELNMLDHYGDGSSCAPGDRLLSDGDVITLGDAEIRVMHTPGHTKGSVCYIFGDTIISGDTLFYENIGRYDFPGGDYNILRKSLKKLAVLDGEYKILPGHGPQTTLSHEKSFNIYLQ